MNRIDARFERLKKAGQKAAVIYLCAGDPNLSITKQLAVALDRIGVDILELGIPFSDPLADGPTNQLAAQRGLASGTTPSGVLQCVHEIRKISDIPIVLYAYFNLIHRYGLQAFGKDAAKAGVDGVLVLDLPPEEAGEFEPILRNKGVHPIYLIAPTTPEERIAFICQHASGFIYYVSREGVTGMRTEVTDAIAKRVSLIKRHTSLPVVVGFGIREPEQAAMVADFADGVVIGSAVVQQIERYLDDSTLCEKVVEFARQFVKAIHTRHPEHSPSL